MSPALKFLIGLAAVLAQVWISLGPLGNGARFIDAAERRARQVVAETEVPGITVALDRSPLRRVATLQGPADAFQRRGQGSLKGITQRVEEVQGIAAVQWADEPPTRRFVLPLVVESMIPALIAYLLGLALGWRLWRRRETGRYS